MLQIKLLEYYQGLGAQFREAVQGGHCDFLLVLATVFNSIQRRDLPSLFPGIFSNEDLYDNLLGSWERYEVNAMNYLELAENCLQASKICESGTYIHDDDVSRQEKELCKNHNIQSNKKSDAQVERREEAERAFSELRELERNINAKTGDTQKEESKQLGSFVDEWIEVVCKPIDELTGELEEDLNSISLVVTTLEKEYQVIKGEYNEKIDDLHLQQREKNERMQEELAALRIAWEVIREGAKRERDSIKMGYEDEINTLTKELDNLREAYWDPSDDEELKVLNLQKAALSYKIMYLTMKTMMHGLW
ncbi:MAG: hypothetical protein ACI9S8_000314 [Chlamydiales bacterium]|jgi:hypothetical protein